MTTSVQTRAAESGRPLVVWRFVDGKPGHENQSLGLAQALADLMPVEVHDVVCSGARWRAFFNLLLARCPRASRLPAPDLLMGAGHATHMEMLACRRARGGRVVVLMRPSLPQSWFDLCVIPEHDQVSASDGVFLTRGVLNPIRAEGPKDDRYGLVLVGGPSSHYGWDAGALCEQLAELAVRDPRRWVVATSRRTPAETVAQLRQLRLEGIELVTCDQTAAGWLAGQMQQAPVAWVTEDSVSMLYEALTAGAACGVLPVPVARVGRVKRGLQRLLSEHVVVAFEEWLQGRALSRSGQSFNEAARCAKWVVSRWFAS